MKIKYLGNEIEATVNVGGNTFIFTGTQTEVFKKVSELTGMKY